MIGPTRSLPPLNPRSVRSRRSNGWAGLVFLASALNIAPMPSRAEGTSSAALPAIEVLALPTCGCCRTWVKYLEADGFTVSVTHIQDLAPVREREGVPEGIAGCHTATADGYVIEGHVSAEEIRQLLRNRPLLKGLVVTGMPPGSPGMEGPGTASYEVLALNPDGTTSVFARHESPPDGLESAPEIENDNARDTETAMPPTLSPVLSLKDPGDVR